MPMQSIQAGSTSFQQSTRRKMPRNPEVSGVLNRGGQPSIKAESKCIQRHWKLMKWVTYLGGGAVYAGYTLGHPSAVVVALIVCRLKTLVSPSASALNHEDSRMHFVTTVTTTTLLKKLMPVQ